MLADDSGPVLSDTAQLVPAVFHGKQSLIKFFGVDVHTAGHSIFHPRLRFLSHISQKEDWGAQIHHSKLIFEQIILPRGRHYVSQNQLTAIESQLMRFSGGHHIAWMDFKQWCGTVPLRKVPIQMKIKSLNCSSCPWIFAFSSIACDEYVCCICFKDKILLRMFILSAPDLRGVCLSYCLKTVSCQFSTFCHYQLV